MSILNPNGDKNGPATGQTGNSPASNKSVDDGVRKEVQRTKARRPMSAPVRRLETTLIPGFHLHWIRQINIPAALDASYQFVTQEEVAINSRNVGLDSIQGNSNDLGDKVSVQYGGDCLYLMKLDQVLYDEDMQKIAERNMDIWSQIFRGEEVAGGITPNPGDTRHRYVKERKIEGQDLARAKQPMFARRYK